MALEVFETLEWAQFFDVASHPHLSHFAVDETARGIKHMITFKEIPIWLTVAVQMFFDVESVFQEEGTLAAPFREYKETVRKAAKNSSKIDPIERPFKGSADSDKKIASIYQNMRNILSDHQDYAIRDRWGRFIQKIKEDKHEPLSKTVDERDYVLKRHPIRCGLLKYELQLQLNHRASKIEQMAGDILYMAWLYVAVSRILHPEMPQWPDMEYLLNGRQDKLFFGEWPKTLDEVGKKIDLGRGYSIANKASNWRSKKDTWDNKQLRRLDDPTVIGELFLKRMGAEPKSTAEAHEWVMKLVSLVCKPESQKILDRQENLPQGTYETSEFLKSVEMQRKPLALLGEIRQWLLADENDLHFDWFGMLHTCTNIWKTIMPAFRKNPVFKDDPNIYNWNVNTVITVLKTESIAQDMGTPMPIFEVVWATLKQFIQAPVSEESGSKTWKGDLHLAKLVDVCNPAMTLMNPGPVSFMSLYANWSDEDKRNSRVGRAVWHLVLGPGRRRIKKEGAKEETDGEESVSEVSAAEEPVNEEPADKEPVNDTPADEDEPSEHSGSQDDETAEIDEAASDAGSGISIQEFSLDLNALASQYKNGGNNIIFMGNKIKAPVAISRAQMGQLRTAPNGDFVLPGGPTSRSSRVQMLPPRQSKRVRGVGAIATTEDAPDLCACGLSRYGVSARPIPTMNTKAAKVEHQCMGALFEGIDVPDRDLGDAIKVTRRKIWRFAKLERKKADSELVARDRGGSIASQCM
ncbi:hypothetical protein J4E86_010461 [Alternaria arbusti]|uniref:uncharacterized protein n=1 Tax=Alternaria arbusti TaxID=232088 RepID=UPI00221EC206|nr:uncharacterized protein J4E86_010461 [Alternaria arbusti]KAI4941428.1 hypothetical protein J4E86_010461 [Alternaria arbusti]